MKRLKFGIDFDGTVVKHEYPEIGETVPFAVETMKALVEAGHVINLNTMRGGVELQQAVNWFKDNGIKLSGINKDKGQRIWTTSTKTFANVYIDDAAYGCPLVRPKDGRPYVDWEVIYLDYKLSGIIE